MTNLEYLKTTTNDDTLILQYTQDGVKKSYVNGNHVDDIVFAG